ARVQRPPASSDEERTFLGQKIGAIRQIIDDRLTHRRQHWNQALFAALADNGQHLAERRFPPSQPERFGKPQAATIKECQNRGVTLALPCAGREFADSIQGARSVLDGQRLRYAVRQLRRAERGERGRRSEAATLQKAQEAAQNRKRPRQRVAVDPISYAVRQVGAKIRRMQPLDRSEA